MRCATTTGSDSRWPFPRPPCAAAAAAGTHRCRRRNAWRPPRTTPGPDRCPARPPWPCGRFSSAGHSRRGARAPGGCPRSGALDPSTPRTNSAAAPNTTAPRPARTPSAPTASVAAPASPTGSPHQADARCPHEPAPARTPRTPGAAPDHVSGARTSDTTPHSPTPPPRRTAPSPAHADHRPTGAAHSPRTHRTHRGPRGAAPPPLDHHPDAPAPSCDQPPDGGRSPRSTIPACSMRESPLPLPV